MVARIACSAAVSSQKAVLNRFELRLLICLIEQSGRAVMER